MANASPEQQIVQSIKDVTNILVTVSKDPSVDELSAALGLTIFLNLLGKHATAVFSGKTPPAITFLEPDKTFEDTADSLRDFIIALDKEKADHLRYKVVDDAVKIFITPYRTTISEQDLDFSQGDYNVELVLALNVEDSSHLDEALESHGRIFHDATIATITSGTIKSGLGSTDWHDSSASSVSEMLVELIDDLKTPKVAMDQQISTALLTGIVATTERFSNDLTSSRTMNAAAELMAAGANQQLIAVQLEDQDEEDVADDNISKSDDTSDSDESVELDEGKSAKVDRKSTKKSKKTAKSKQDDGSLQISHEKKGDIDDVARQTANEQREDAARIAQSRLDDLTKPETEEESEPSLGSESEQTPESPAEPSPLADLPPVVAASEPVSTDMATQFEETPILNKEDPSVDKITAAESELSQPSIGGTLNATTEQAAEDKRRELVGDQNKTILRHGGSYTDTEPVMGDIPLNAAMGVSDEPSSVDLFKQAPNSVSDDNSSVLSAIKEDTNAIGDTHQDARSAVDAALAAVPDTSSQPPISQTPTLADIEASQGLPPMPDFSTLPPPPPMPVGTVPDGITSLDAPVSGMPTSAPDQRSPQPNFSQPQQDFAPGQFHIPGQQ